MISPNPNIESTIRINSQGLRGPQREPSPRPGRPRVLVVGDSFVQAFEVDYEKTFYALDEERARARGEEIEIIPMGTMGYGQAQELLWLREEGMALHPDLVVALVFVSNDISDNSYDLAPTNIRPYFELVDGELQLTHLPTNAARLKYQMASWLRSYRIYKELFARVSGLRSIARDLGFSNRGRADTPSQRENRAARLRSAFDLTFALLLEMRDTAEAAGSAFAIAHYGDLDTRSDQTDDELFDRFCRESGLDCLNLDDFVGDCDECIVPLDHHWNERGHAIVADQMWNRWFGKPAQGARGDPDAGSILSARGEE